MLRLATTLRYFSKHHLSLQISLPSLVLASLLGTAPSLAVTQDAEQVVSDWSEPVLTAGFFDVLEDINNVVQDAEVVLQQQRRQQVRQQQESEAQHRQQERDSITATQDAQRQLEAQREREYFESLNPEQQQAYIEEKQRQEAAQIEAATTFMLWLFSTDGGSGTSTTSEDSQIMYDQQRTPSQPTYRSPTPTVGGNSGFYVNGPQHGTRAAW